MERTLSIGMWRCGDTCECANISIGIYEEDQRAQVWESSWANGYWTPEYMKLVERMKEFGAKYSFDIDVHDVEWHTWERVLDPDEVIELPPKEAPYP